LFWSTSASGKGIDAATVRVVIHVGAVDKLDNFAQQSGCAGVTASKKFCNVCQGREKRRVHVVVEDKEEGRPLPGGNSSKMSTIPTLLMC